MLTRIPRTAPWFEPRTSPAWYNGDDFLSIDSTMLELVSGSTGVLHTPQGDFGTTAVSVAEAEDQSPFGTSLVIAGTGYQQNIRVPGNVSILADTNVWAIDYWVREFNSSRPAFCPIMSTSPRAQSNRFEIGGWDTDTTMFALWNNAAVPRFTCSGAKTAMQTWRHLAIQQNGTTLSFYVNGVRVGAGTFNRLSTTGTLMAINKLTASKCCVDRYRARKGAVHFTGTSFSLDSLY